MLGKQNRPTPGNIEKINGNYRYKLTVKCRNDRRFRDLMRETLGLYEQEKLPSRAPILVDINYSGHSCSDYLEVYFMAIRNIVKEGDPILNKVCRPVTNFDDRLATLLDDMRETMIAADGVGLAGPQVGMMRRLFVVWDTTDAPEEIPEDYEYKFIDFVNPEILAVSEEEETAYEGCLSFPGHNGAVTRPVAVKVRAQDRNGEWFELEADGLLGRCIQHENDHLDGP